MPNTVPAITPNCFTTAGPVQVWTNTGESGAFEYLGDTRGGARIAEQGFFDELKSDVSGGERGPAADYQFLGEQHTIELDLARYSNAVLAKVAARVNVATVTSGRTKGMLVGCAGGQFQVVLISSNFARKYTKVFVVQPIDMAPIGTAATFPRVVLVGLEDPNNTTSPSSSGSGAPVNGSPWNGTITVSGSTLS